MATHSSVLAWRIPWTEKPGRLQCMGSHRVRHDWSNLAAAAEQRYAILGNKMSTTSRSTRRRQRHPLQYSCLENPWTEEPGRLQSMGSKSQTWLSDFTFTFYFHALEKEMATHSSILAWRIPGMGKPGGMPSMGSHRVRHNGSDLAAAAVGQQLKKVWYVISGLV